MLVLLVLGISVMLALAMFGAQHWSAYAYVIAFLNGLLEFTAVVLIIVSLFAFPPNEFPALCWSPRVLSPSAPWPGPS
jgi:hypothetical protein